MSASLPHLAALALGGAANLALLVAICRASPRLGLLRASVLAACLGLVVVLAMPVLFSERWTVADAAADALTYACFCYALLHFNNMGETARRVRLARELAAAPEGLTEAALIARYGSREQIDRRLARLVATGQIRTADGRLTIANPAALAMARTIAIAKRIVLGAARERAWPREPGA